MEFYTIGVYNSTEKDFFNKLQANRIDTFCDIRQRRGLRGSKYSFVNSIRLQDELAKRGINYVHVISLAPTEEIRNKQKIADIQNNELKRERQQLGQVFTIEYKSKIINTFDFELFFEQLSNIGAKKIILFCVEEHPEACHRSIVAKALKEKYNYQITHL